MKINIIKINGIDVAEIISEEIVISDNQDALDLIANCFYNSGSNKIIIYEKNLTPDFFDLKTGIAGEILQKFSNYNSRLIIVGDFSKYTSKSLKDFIYESNKQKNILFLNSKDEIKQYLRE